jgi:hypothetical protein
MGPHIHSELHVDIKAILESWPTLNAFLNSATEKEAQELLKAELKGRKRKNCATRIYSRFNRMRADRERKELLDKLV